MCSCPPLGDIGKKVVGVLPLAQLAIGSPAAALPRLMIFDEAPIARGDTTLTYIPAITGELLLGSSP
jgi:hypothetical protein